jgi:hypothetical protein
MHCPRPFEIDKGIVEQAKFMGIHIIWKAKLKNLSTCLMKQAILIKVHHRGDGDTLLTQLLGEIQDMLKIPRTSWQANLCKFAETKACQFRNLNRPERQNNVPLTVPQVLT